MRTFWATAGALALGLLAGSAQAGDADTFASQPTRVLVPFSAGGGLDLVARLMAAQLNTMWGQPVVVENKPGAGGIIASRELVASKPDGHTLLVVAGGHALNPLIYKDVPYDTQKDFTPISVLVAAGNVVLVPKDSPLKTIADVIAEAKKTPGGLQYGTAGNGTSVHLAGELFARDAKVPMQPVHFKGDSDSLTALIGNHISLSFNSLIGALPQIQKGQVRAIAVTSPKREAALPDVPTVAESGVPGYSVVNWWGILGPANMPKPILDKLNADIHAALQDPKSQERLKALGVSLDLSTPKAFADLIDSEMKRWAPMVKEAGIKAQ